MAAGITWLISFEKVWLRVVSAMTGNPPLLHGTELMKYAETVPSWFLFIEFRSGPSYLKCTLVSNIKVPKKAVEINQNQ